MPEGCIVGGGVGLWSTWLVHGNIMIERINHNMYVQLL